MKTDRRAFLAGLAAVAVAPKVVPAETMTFASSDIVVPFGEVFGAPVLTEEMLCEAMVALKRAAGDEPVFAVAPRVTYPRLPRLV